MDVIAVVRAVLHDHLNGAMGVPKPIITPFCWHWHQFGSSILIEGPDNVWPCRITKFATIDVFVHSVRMTVTHDYAGINDFQALPAPGFGLPSMGCEKSYDFGNPKFPANLFSDLKEMQNHHMLVVEGRKDELLLDDRPVLDDDTLDIIGGMLWDKLSKRP